VPHHRSLFTTPERAARNAAAAAMSGRALP
jgi:hypothetical protein